MSVQGWDLYGRTTGVAWRHLGCSPCCFVRRRQVKPPSSQPPSFLSKESVHLSTHRTLHGENLGTRPAEQRAARLAPSRHKCLGLGQQNFPAQHLDLEALKMTLQWIKKKKRNKIKLEVEANWEFKFIQLQKLREAAYSLVTASENLSNSLWIVPELQPVG